MNITLPEPLAKRLDKVANKSAFVARAVLERFKSLREEELERRLAADYRHAAAHPEELEDARDDW